MKCTVVEVSSLPGSRDSSFRISAFDIMRPRRGLRKQRNLARTLILHSEALRSNVTLVADLRSERARFEFVNIA